MLDASLGAGREVLFRLLPDWHRFEAREAGGDTTTGEATLGGLLPAVVPLVDQHG